MISKITSEMRDFVNSQWFEKRDLWRLNELNKSLGFGFLIAIAYHFTIQPLLSPSEFQQGEAILYGHFMMDLIGMVSLLALTFATLLFALFSNSKNGSRRDRFAKLTLKKASELMHMASAVGAVMLGAFMANFLIIAITKNGVLIDPFGAAIFSILMVIATAMVSAIKRAAISCETHAPTIFQKSRPVPLLLMACVLSLTFILAMTAFQA